MIERVPSADHTLTKWRNDEMTNEAINTLAAKLYLKLAHLDLSSGLSITWDAGTESIMVRIKGHTITLFQTDTPTEWALNGRKNWRAIRAFCHVAEALKEVSGVRTVTLLTREEVKARLAAIPKTKKGEPKPSPVRSQVVSPSDLDGEAINGGGKLVQSGVDGVQLGLDHSRNLLALRGDLLDSVHGVKVRAPEHEGDGPAG